MLNYYTMGLYGGIHEHTGLPKKVERRLYGICYICFLVFRVPCSPKLA